MRTERATLVVMGDEAATTAVAHPLIVFALHAYPGVVGDEEDLVWGAPRPRGRSARRSYEMRALHSLRPRASSRCDTCEWSQRARKDFVRCVAENYHPASRAAAIDPDVLGDPCVDEVLAANVATEVAVSAELGGIAMTRIARLLQSDRAVIVATSADSGAFLTELRALLANRSDVDASLARVTLVS